MLASMKELLIRAQKGSYAVPNFDIWNTEMLSGIMDAAEESRSPVILAFGSGFFENVDFTHFTSLMVSMAKASTVPVVIHWDHGEDLELLKRAEQSGFNSMMLDCSALPYPENVILTKEAVDYFHLRGIPVESELGHIGPEMDYDMALKNYGYTDPALAKDFVEKTGIDALAIAIGNAHGPYSSKPQIRFEILEAARNAVDIPLVLHGASGIGDEDIIHCIKLGITKINIHTELCQAAMDALKNHISTAGNYLGLQRFVREAVKQRALEKIYLFGSNDKAF